MFNMQSSNSKNVLKIAIGGAVVYYILSRKTLFEKTIFSFKGIKINGTILNPELTVKIQANNATNFSQKIDSINGNITLNDTIDLGEILLNKPFEILPKSIVEIEIPVSIRLSGIINTLSQIFSKKTGVYTFNGYAVVSGLSIPIIQSITL